MKKITKIVVYVLMLSFSVCMGKEFKTLGPYKYVKILKVNYKGIQIVHSDGMGYIDLKLLSENDRKLIANAIAKHISLKAKKDEIIRKKMQKDIALEEKRQKDDLFVENFIKTLKDLQSKSGNLLKTYEEIAKIYKLKIAMPKSKNDVLPQLYGPHNVVCQFVKNQTKYSSKQEKVLDLLDKYHREYQAKRSASVYKRNEKLAAASLEKTNNSSTRVSDSSDNFISNRESNSLRKEIVQNSNNDEDKSDSMENSKTVTGVHQFKAADMCRRCRGTGVISFLDTTGQSTLRVKCPDCFHGVDNRAFGRTIENFLLSR